MKSKNTLNEIKRFQKIAGIISEGEYKQFVSEKITDQVNISVDMSMAGENSSKAEYALQKYDIERVRDESKWPVITIRGDKNDLIRFLTDESVGMDYDEVKDAYPELFVSGWGDTEYPDDYEFGDFD